MFFFYFFKNFSLDVLCCDIIVGRGDGSKVGFPETALGIIPAAGGTYRIYKKMNQGLAKYWILTGKQFSIEEAFDIGFVDLIIKDDSEIGAGGMIKS